MAVDKATLIRAASKFNGITSEETLACFLYSNSCSRNKSCCDSFASAKNILFCKKKKQKKLVIIYCLIKKILPFLLWLIGHPFYHK